MFIGRPAAPRTNAAARAASGAVVLRVLTPGMMGTMDYRADRLTLTIAADGRIAGLRCG